MHGGLLCVVPAASGPQSSICQCAAGIASNPKSGSNVGGSDGRRFPKQPLFSFCLERVLGETNTLVCKRVLTPFFKD